MVVNAEYVEILTKIQPHVKTKTVENMEKASLRKHTKKAQSLQSLFD